MKVGMSKNVKSRLKALQVANPYKLQVFAIWAAPAAAYENDVHHALPNRLCGEWFDWSPDVESLLASPDVVAWLGPM